LNRLAAPGRTNAGLIHAAVNRRQENQMDIFTGDIGPLVFKSRIHGNVGQFSLDGQMLAVLMNLDGKRDCAELARTVNLNVAALRQVLAALSRLGLIEKVPTALPVVEAGFIAFVRSRLALAVGPIADILIEDTLEDMKLNGAQVPRARAAELVEMLARQIPREEKRLAFQQEMIAKITEKKA